MNFYELHAADSALLTHQGQGLIRSEDSLSQEAAAHFWVLGVFVVFLKAYLEWAIHGPFIPKAKKQVQALLEKAIYELGYEFNKRPQWMMIPVREIQELLRIPG